MYQITDKEAAIKSIQKYLSKIYKDEIMVSETGFFDQNTLLALNRFQNENALKEATYVDYYNFTLLFDRYMIETERENRRKNANVTYPLTRGYKNPEMYGINNMLLGITRHYGHFIPISVSDYFSEDTENALKIVNDIFNFGDVNYIDELLHSRIIKEWNSIRKAEYFP